MFDNNINNYTYCGFCKERQWMINQYIYDICIGLSSTVYDISNILLTFKCTSRTSLCTC